jgi:Caspase domain
MMRSLFAQFIVNVVFTHLNFSVSQDYIVNVHGFPEVKGLMTVLLDDDDHKHPTFLNITEAFKVLSEESQPGDAVFVQFSGHGGRILDAPMDEEAESYDETVVPCDYQVSGLIRDTLIFKTLLAPMRYGVTVTILIDCCDTGMVVELPYSWSTKSDKRDHLAKVRINLVAGLFSFCILSILVLSVLTYCEFLLLPIS